MCSWDWLISPAKNLAKFLISQLLSPEMQHVSYHQSNIKEERGRNDNRAIKKAKEANN